MKSEIESKLQEVTSLISLPEVYITVNSLMDDPNSDIYSFAEVVMVDPNLSALILKLVNSAYFGFPDPIENIAQAISLIGLSQFHNIVLGVSAISSLNLPGDAISLERFWSASLHTGVLAQLLAKRTEVSHSEQMFVAGLLHEIGHLVLYAHFPSQALAAANYAEDKGIQIQEAEVELLGCHYGDIGAILMGNWNLPTRIQILTRNQPFPHLACEDQHDSTLMQIAHIYGQLRSAEKVADQSENPQSQITGEMLIVLGILQEELELDMATADTVSADMAKVILG